MSDHQDQPSSQGKPSGYEEGRQAGQAGEKGQRDKAGKARGEEPNPPPPPNIHTSHCRAPGRSRTPTGPTMEPNGPARERVCPRVAQQHARARSARHTQAKQGTRAAPHASRHQGTKHDTTTANTHARRRTSRQEQVQAPQSPQRNSRRPDGRLCTQQGT